MKKFLLFLLVGLLFLAAILIFILPWGLGLLIKDRYEDVLGTLSKSGNLEFKVVQYQRGWFNSNATIEVHPTGSSSLLFISNKAAAPVSFLVTQTIEHGPILKFTTAAGKTHWLLGQALIKSQTQPSIGAINSMTLVRITGSLLSAVTAPIIHFSNPEKKLLLVMKGLTMSLNLSGDLTHIKLRFYIPQLDMQSDDFQQKISGFDAQYDLRKTASGLLWGNKITAIDHLLWKTYKIQSQAEISGLFVKMHSSEHGGKVTYAINATLKNLSIANTSYGLQHLDLLANDLDLDTILALNTQLKNLQQGDSLSPQQLAAFNNLLFQLPQKGMQLNIRELLITTPWGAPQIYGQLIWPALAPNKTDQDLNSERFNAHVHCLFPARFLEQALEKMYPYLVKNKLLTQVAQTSGANMPTQNSASQIIAWWVQHKWLIPQDDSYALDLIYKNREITANGQAFQLQELFPSTETNSSASDME